jgi:predicted Zn-dependent protease with MMP-like domain
VKPEDEFDEGEYIDEAERFDELVDEALEDVPDEFAQYLENVEVDVRPHPSRKVLREMGIGRGGTLLGLYRGHTQFGRHSGYGNVLPDQIEIYREPVLDEADALCPEGGDFEQTVRDIVRKTVLHEIGHHFGLTDEDLRRLDYG